MSNNKSMVIYIGVASILLMVLILTLHGRFFSALDSHPEQTLSEPLAASQTPAPIVPVAQTSSPHATAPSSVVPTPPKAVTLLSSQQAKIAGLDLTKNTQTDELLREIEAMNQDIEQLLSKPTIEERQQVDVAVTAQAEALALIRQVDAQHGLNSLALVDQQFEQSQITDPQLQQIIAEGQQLEDEIATIAQALQ